LAAASLFVGVGAVVIAAIGAVAGGVTGVVSISIFLPSESPTRPEPLLLRSASAS